RCNRARVLPDEWTALSRLRRFGKLQVPVWRSYVLCGALEHHGVRYGLGALAAAAIHGVGPLVELGFEQDEGLLPTVPFFSQLGWPSFRWHSVFGNVHAPLWAREPRLRRGDRLGARRAMARQSGPGHARPYFDFAVAVGRVQHGVLLGGAAVRRQESGRSCPYR